MTRYAVSTVKSRDWREHDAAIAEVAAMPGFGLTFAPIHPPSG